MGFLSLSDASHCSGFSVAVNSPRDRGEPSGLGTLGLVPVRELCGSHIPHGVFLDQGPSQRPSSARWTLTPGPPGT